MKARDIIEGLSIEFIAEPHKIIGDTEEVFAVVKGEDGELYDVKVKVAPHMKHVVDHPRFEDSCSPNTIIEEA